MKRAFVTGIAGFVGSHMAELLLARGWEVWGLFRTRSKTDNIGGIIDKLHLVDADLMDAHSLYAAFVKARPDAIFHLAAQSFVPTSWSSPSVTLETNIIGTANLFEAVRQAKLDPVIQIACSSEEYGLVHPDEVPIKETNPLRPQSPYGVSKVAMDYLGYQYHCSYGMRILRTRGFNHTGPRRGDTFVTSNFAKQIATIEKGDAEPVMRVGNLEAVRDWTDVRDMVAGYLVAIDRCDPGEDYNICSGRGVRVGDMLDILLSHARVKVKVEQDPARLRPSEVPVLIGDNTKFRRKTDWDTTIPFETTMLDLLNYWRGRV